MNNLINKTPLQQIGQFATPENIGIYNRLFSWKTQPPKINETYPEIKDTFEVWYSFSGKSDDVVFPEIAMIKRGISSGVYEIYDEQIKYPEKHTKHNNPHMKNLFNKIKMVDAIWFVNRFGGDFFYFRTDVLSPNATDATELHRNKKLHLNGNYRLFVTDPRERGILFTMQMRPRILPKHEYLSLNNSLKLISGNNTYSINSTLLFNHNDTIELIDYYFFNIEGLEYYLKENDDYFSDNTATNVMQLSFYHSPNIKQVDTLIALSTWNDIDFSTANNTTWNSSGHSSNLFEYPFKPLEHGETFTFYFKVTYSNPTPTWPDVIIYYKITIQSGKYIKVWEDEVGNSIPMQYGTNPIYIKEMFDRKSEFIDNIKITYADVENSIYKFKATHDTIIDTIAQNSTMTKVKYIDQFNTDSTCSYDSDLSFNEADIIDVTLDTNDNLYEYSFDLTNTSTNTTPDSMLMMLYGRYNGFWFNDSSIAGPEIAFLNKPTTHISGESTGSDFELVNTLEGLSITSNNTFTYSTIVAHETYTESDLSITKMT